MVKAMYRPILFTMGLILLAFGFWYDYAYAQSETFHQDLTPSLRPFPSVEVLERWLERNNVNKVPQILQAGNFTLIWDCDDYALNLQRDALEDGFLINVQIFKSGTKLPMSDKVVPKAHAMNSAVIGNEVYLIEPSTDEFWFAWYLD